MTNKQKNQYYPLIPIVLLSILYYFISGLESTMELVFIFILNMIWVFIVAKFLKKIFKKLNFWQYIQIVILLLLFIKVFGNIAFMIENIFLYTTIYLTYYFKREEFSDKSEAKK